MTCEEVRVEFVECWGSTEQLCAAAVAHLEVCAQCRYEALILRETFVMVRSLPGEHAPAGFTGRVLDQIASEQAQPGWAARIAEMFVPSRQPSWARAAAVGTAIALAVAGGAVWVNHGLDGGSPEQIVSGGPTAIAVSSPAASEAELDELLLRHQALEMTQPLADDAGVSLVVYTSN